jgi:hypothetical protein
MATFHSVITIYPADTKVDGQIAIVIGHQYLMKKILVSFQISRKYPSECRKNIGIYNIAMINQSYDIYKGMYPEMAKILDFE